MVAGVGVYLAQKASNFQRGCKNGVGTRVAIRGPLVGSIKRRLAFLPPTSSPTANGGVVLTPLSCFPSFPAFLFSAAGKLSVDPLSLCPVPLRRRLHAFSLFFLPPLGHSTPATAFFFPFYGHASRSTQIPLGSLPPRLSTISP